MGFLSSLLALHACSLSMLTLPPSNKQDINFGVFSGSYWRKGCVCFSLAELFSFTLIYLLLSVLRSFPCI